VNIFIEIQKTTASGGGHVLTAMPLEKQEGQAMKVLENNSMQKRSGNQYQHEV
jgi:hypothetical protein